MGMHSAIALGAGNVGRPAARAVFSHTYLDLPRAGE
jgi:saccharopine dehydrogenase-like NADP-dependent oxidoreductase